EAPGVSAWGWGQGRRCVREHGPGRPSRRGSLRQVWWQVGASTLSLYAVGCGGRLTASPGTTHNRGRHPCAVYWPGVDPSVPSLGGVACGPVAPAGSLGVVRYGQGRKQAARGWVSARVTALGELP